MPRDTRSRRSRGWGNAITGYFERHAQTLVSSLGRLLSMPLATFLTMAVIGAALAIPGCIYVLVQNARSVSVAYTDALDLSVYLKAGASESQAHALSHQIGLRTDVASVRVVSASEGLKQFREWSGMGVALDALKDNPLPHAIIVKPRASQADPSVMLDVMQRELMAMPGVDQVSMDAAWVHRFLALLDALSRTLRILAILLAVAVLVVVGNTIRLDIDVRRPEIEVTKLVGGSDAFVRRPFLYGGLWYGLGGGLIAYAVVSAFILGLSGPIDRVAAAYGSHFVLHNLQGGAVLTLLLGGALLGWLGAYLSATWQLAQIEPSSEK